MIRGRYETKDVLGKGSYGTVYRAYDKTKDRYVAIKQLNVANPKVLDSLNTELAAYKALSQDPTCHERIVCLYDYFYVSPYAYIVLELMDGDVEEKKLNTSADILAFLRDSLEGLAYIHGKGYAHRDIKPENILRRGSIFKIADLGMLCAKEQKGSIEKCTVRGTPAFLAPEFGDEKDRYAPRSLQDAQRADIWSLGATFFEVITGDLPYEDEDNVPAMTQDQIRILEDDLPYGIVPGATISALINSMLRRDPKQRPSAGTLLSTLEEARKRCTLNDGRRLKRDDIKKMLDELDVVYLDNAPLEELCRLLKDRLQCRIRGLQVSDETVRLMQSVFGISKPVRETCEEITKLLIEKEKVYRRKIAETVHAALETSAMYQKNHDEEKMKKFDAIISEVMKLSIAVDGIDIKYLKDRRKNEEEAAKIGNEQAQYYVEKYDRYVRSML